MNAKEMSLSDWRESKLEELRSRLPKVVVVGQTRLGDNIVECPVHGKIIMCDDDRVICIFCEQKIHEDLEKTPEQIAYRQRQARMRRRDAEGEIEFHEMFDELR